MVDTLWVLLAILVVQLTQFYVVLHKTPIPDCYLPITLHAWPEYTELSVRHFVGPKGEKHVTGRSEAK